LPRIGTTIAAVRPARHETSTGSRAAALGKSTPFIVDEVLMIGGNAPIIGAGASPTRRHAINGLAVMR
jgi:hypothetical protein